MKQNQNVQSEMEDRESLNSENGVGGGGYVGRSRTVSEVESVSSINTTMTSASGTPRTSKIFLYSKGTFEPIEYESSDRCEDVCIKICRLLRFKPTVVLLFNLRAQNSNCFLPGCGYLEPNVQYEFRIRFKMPDHTELKKLDLLTYAYYFAQVKYDLLHGKFPCMNYNQDKEKILGLSVADMYLQMIQSNVPIQTLIKNHKLYIPKQIEKTHSIFARNCIKNALNKIEKKDHDAYYVMESYLSQVNSIGKFYLLEEYIGSSDYLPEGDASSRKRPTCPVTIQICPVHGEEAVLKVHYSYKDYWLTVRFDDINVIIIEDDTKIKIQRINDYDINLYLQNKATAQSIVSGLAGYYRLMVRWMCDPCPTLYSPSLKRLSDLRCNGPIGGTFAYKKLSQNSFNSGFFLIRQCDQVYDTYYLDIKITRSKIETFKIVYRRDTGQWCFHSTDTDIEKYDSLAEVGKNIKTEAQQNSRVAPSVYDKPPNLLLCLKDRDETDIARKSVRSTVVGEVDLSEPKCIDPVMLKWFRDSTRDCEGGLMSQMRAEWKVSENQCIDVTLKSLKPDKIAENITNFMHFTQKWCRLKSTDILKIYGITLYNPIAMVMESTKLGPLSELLRRERQKVPLLDLIDVAHSLTKALHYLQSLNFVHGKIRCSTLQVVKYESFNLVVRLGDPGIGMVYTEHDLPWIPTEYHSNKMKLSSVDLLTDVWAYATTLWEIFTYGSIPPRDAFKTPAYNLPIPRDCPKVLYKMMCLAWDRDSEKRSHFQPQQMFIQLNIARTQVKSAYQEMMPSSRIMFGNRTHSDSLGSKSSVASASTEQVELYSNGNGSNSVGDYSGSESSINNFETMTVSTVVPGSASGSSFFSNTPSNMDYLDGIPSVIETDDYRVVLQGQIGAGFYGSVSKGELFSNYQNKSMKVAVKLLKSCSSSIKDFENESKIMKALEHKNIVRIIDFIHDTSVAIIMEYVEKCNLQVYLKSKSFTPTMNVLLKFAKDIASGMEYLQLKNIVHRDLAARNVLVDSDDTLKISDFGLARPVDNTGYYMVQAMDKALPIPWYAPETLNYQVYSILSDVWSYGVTMFEVFSGGQDPVLVEGKTLTPDEMIQALGDGIRLRCPKGCPPVIYDRLMKPCWEYEKMKRPTFTIILQTIEKIVPEFGERV